MNRILLLAFLISVTPSIAFGGRIALTFDDDQMLSTMKGFTKWYRYPYLDKGETQESRDKIWIAIQKMGYFDAYITVETYDWHLNSVLNQALHEKKQVNLESFKNLYISHVWRMIQFHDDLARKVLDRSPKHVLLLHENDLAALFIDDLIADIRSKGWKIISPQEAYSDPIAIQERDTTFRYQHRLVAIARFKKYQYIGPNELNTGYLDGLIADAGAVKMADK